VAGPLFAALDRVALGGSALASSRFAVLPQQGDQIGESSPVGGVGAELELELGQSAAILA
jgi:hypothetical protein